MAEIRFVTEAGEYVEEGHPLAAYRINPSDPISGDQVKRLRKKSGYVPPSEQVIEPAEAPEEPAGADFSDSLREKLTKAGLVDEESLKAATDEQLKEAGLVASQIQKFRTVYPASE